MYDVVVKIHLDDDERSYIDSCARIRRMSTTRLMSQLIGKVCHDQLVLAVMDDDSKHFLEKRPYHKKEGAS